MTTLLPAIQKTSYATTNRICLDPVELAEVEMLAGSKMPEEADSAAMVDWLTVAVLTVMHGGKVYVYH